ncbi:MAG: GDSL-like Lipase/Acylhydrolase family protein [Verrucomicrobia bacterium]|jgi:lysophospholipase L1-like esterase|nr:MAG: GDSL-like Lipase/Acylhydrolase family protein [Verrucomicrobiota bacterium]
MPILRTCLLLVWAAVPVWAQDAAPQDRNPVNSAAAAPVRSGMLADSPVVFPEKGALPALFPPDLEVVRYPAETDFVRVQSPCRSLAQIEAIQAAMPKVSFAAPVQDWQNLARTRKRLVEGGDLHLLALGDSIVNDTMRSGWIARLQQACPQTRIRATVYVRGGGGCRHYREEGRVQKYLVPLRPDLVLIGGISQGKDPQPIRDVISQIRASLPDCEFVLATGAFGIVDPRDAAAMALAPHSATSAYGPMLQGIATELGCAYLDMTTPWIEAIRSSGRHPHVFYRDRVHANEFGEQILGRILVAWLTRFDPGAAIP